MKIEKNKMVFATVLVVIVLFLLAYTLMVMDNGKSESEHLKQTLVPPLEETQKQYKSKLDALNDLKDVRETNAPSIYDEKLMDSLGFYDRDLPEREKERIVDSIYSAGKINYSERSYQVLGERKPETKKVQEIDSTEIKREQKIEAKELGLEHQLFFAASPKPDERAGMGTTDYAIYVAIDGDQVVKTNSRLRMRLTKAAVINNKQVPKNTLVFGFINFQPNRAMINIENIQHQSTKLKAYDLQDGSEGIYIENNFRAEATDEVVDDIIGDINIPSIPQVGGISKVLKRHNRSVKVTVLNNYQLILKP